MTGPQPSFLLSHSLPQPHPSNSTSPDRAAPPHAALHLMPFSIAHDGSAKISTYFLPRPTPSDSSEPGPNQSNFEASFRGRYLHGTRVNVPEGYTGLVLSSSAETDSTTNQLNRLTGATKTGGPTVLAVGRGSGRARGRARGRRLGQAVSARSDSPRVARKRKANEPDGFLSEDEAEDLDGSGKNESQADGPVGARDPDSSAEKVAVPTQLACEDIRSCPPTATESACTGLSSGTFLSVPNGHLVDQKPGPQPHGSSKLVKALASFENITIWNPDGCVDMAEDIYARSMNEWVGIAQLLHSVPSS